MKEINRGELALALAKSLGMRGGLVLPLDESLVPTVQTFDLSLAPYSGIDQPFHNSTFAAAIAAQNGYVWFQPTLQTIVQIKKVTVQNPAAATNCKLLFLTPQDVTGLGAPTATTQIVAAGQGFTSATTTKRLPGAVNVATNASAVIGTAIDRVSVAANGMALFTLPDRGLWIEGSIPDAPSGMTFANPGGIGIVNETVNQAITVNMSGTIWQLA